MILVNVANEKYVNNWLTPILGSRASVFRS